MGQASKARMAERLTARPRVDARMTGFLSDFSLPRRACRETGLMPEWAFCLPPGLHPVRDGARVGEPRGLRRLYRHGRPLAEGAEEDETSAATLAELIQQAVSLQAFLHVGIGNVQGARDNPIFTSLLILPEIDQGNI